MIFKDGVWKFLATAAVSTMPCIYAYHGTMLSWWQWLFLLSFYYIIWADVKDGN